MIAASGLNPTLRSHEDLPTATTDIYVADTMGELGLFYRLAPIVFMGGSLVEHGGQNPIEAIKLGASIIHGPHVFNFTDVYEALDAAGGARRADTQEALVKQFGQMLADPKAREAVLAASERVVGQLGGALERTLARSSRICCSCGSRWEPPMREPGFWHGPASLNAHLLKPLAALYGAIAAQRLQRKGLNAGIPVLCVGNYHVGGAGKTPTVLALAKLLRELGETPVVLSRGYGGKLRGPVRVDPVRHAASDVGDEPLMLAGRLPVVVSRKRADGVPLARAQGATVILMDDGFQSPAVVKDASLIVIDSERGLGNGQVFPAGPLRAPLRPQLARTDALIVVGNGSAAEPVAAEIAAQGKPVLSAHLKPDEAQVAQLRGKRVLAFAGIGDPARFFNTLRASGIEVAGQRAFADHHPYSQAEIESLIAEARRDGADAGDDGKGSGAACGIGRSKSCRSR